jgi:hypothetical protein
VPAVDEGDEDEGGDGSKDETGEFDSKYGGAKCPDRGFLEEVVWEVYRVYVDEARGGDAVGVRDGFHFGWCEGARRLEVDEGKQKDEEDGEQ